MPVRFWLAPLRFFGTQIKMVTVSHYHCFLFTTMLHKLKQQINRFKFTDSNRLPLRRARQFLMNRFRTVRLDMPSAPLRAAMGLVR